MNAQTFGGTSKRRADLFCRSAAGDTGIAGALVLGHAAGGLTDDFQQAHEGEVELTVGIEVGAGLAARHLHRLTGVVEHVPQPEIGIMARRSTPPPLPGPGHGSKG